MPKIDIVAIGEPVVEMVRLPPPATAAPWTHTYRSVVGGDALNCLVAAARQWARTALVSAVGDDMLGADILGFCRAEGIDIRGVSVDPAAPTGAVFIDPDPAERRFHYMRKGSAASHFALGDMPEELIASSRVLHLTGISLAISPSMRQAAMRAVDVARSAGVLVSFDPNYRPKLWSSEEARAAIDALLPLVDIALPTEDEAYALTGLSEAADVIDAFAKAGPGLVILKRGPAGVVLQCEGQRIAINAPRVDAIDSTGAGDSFAGAFLAHYLETGDAVRAASAAVNVAAGTVTGWGATEAIPRRVSD